ncbi:hypothetical protein DIPPA_10173 [Diplonema papillatum]|nr:hypothetical protein DIPPA_10173 [Diplonema papillatum]
MLRLRLREILEENEARLNGRIVVTDADLPASAFMEHTGCLGLLSLEDDSGAISEKLKALTWLTGHATIKAACIIRDADNVGRVLEKCRSIGIADAPEVLLSGAKLPSIPRCVGGVGVVTCTILNESIFHIGQHTAFPFDSSDLPPTSDLLLNKHVPVDKLETYCATAVNLASVLQSLKLDMKSIWCMGSSGKVLGQLLQGEIQSVPGGDKGGIVIIDRTLDLYTPFGRSFFDVATTKGVRDDDAKPLLAGNAQALLELEKKCISILSGLQDLEVTKLLPRAVSNASRLLHLFKTTMESPKHYAAALKNAGVVATVSAIAGEDLKADDSSKDVTGTFSESLQRLAKRMKAVLNTHDFETLGRETANAVRGLFMAASAAVHDGCSPRCRHRSQIFEFRCRISSGSRSTRHGQYRTSLPWWQTRMTA